VRVFFDTNVVLDVLLGRQPFYAASVAAWSLAEEGRIEGFVSAITFTTIFYVVRKQFDARRARQVLTKLHGVFSVVDCEARLISAALNSDIKDFEDAVQYFSAVQAKAECLLSRNPGDFPRSGFCPVLTPAEFLATHAFE
jgi:predicted nucleic acid-binding protein